MKGLALRTTPQRGSKFTDPPLYDHSNRAGANLFANSLVALDAATGKRRWHFQTVHHDLGDRDLPAPPHLLTVRHNGRPIDAVAQITKTGFVFLFDRVTGAPLFPIDERPVPASDIPGERAWPTQPFPALERRRLTKRQRLRGARGRIVAMQVARNLDEHLRQPFDGIVAQALATPVHARVAGGVRGHCGAARNRRPLQCA